MDSAIILFIITILQTILDCNGLREQRRRLQTHRRRVDDLDDFRIPRRSNFFYAGMNPSQSYPHVQLPERPHKTGARTVKNRNSMSITYGGNLDKSEEEEIYEPDYRRASVPRNAKPALIIALLRSDKGVDAPEENLSRFYSQNDGRTPELDLRKTNSAGPRRPPSDINFKEQQRAVKLLEMPIAHYVKDYHNIGLELQKRAVEVKQRQQQGRELPSEPSDTHMENMQNYNNFKEGMLQNQNRYKIIQDEDKGRKIKVLSNEYERKTNEYNFNRVPQPNDPQAFALQNQGMSIPRHQAQNVVTPRPPMQDPRPQTPALQYRDIMVLREQTTSQPYQDRVIPEEIMPNWQAEPKPQNFAVPILKNGDENYNWQAVLDKSSANLADMSIDSLVSEYRKLEQEIVRRKQVLENYKKSLQQPSYGDQMSKPDAPQPNYDSFPQSRPSLSDPQSPQAQPNQQRPSSSLGSDPRGQQIPLGSSGLSDSRGQQSSLGQSGWPGPPGPQGPQDSYQTSPTPAQYMNEETPVYNQPYLSDSELATLFTPANQRLYEVTTEPYQFDLGIRHNLQNEAKVESKENTNKAYGRETPYGDETPTGIVTYANRKSFDEPEFDQLYVIYLQRLRPMNGKKKRLRRKPSAASYHYAYVDLEHLEEVIKKYRRQQDSQNMGFNDNMGKEDVDDITLIAKSGPNKKDDNDIIISSEFSSEFRPVKNDKPDAKSTWFANSRDAYNHIKLDQEAPDMLEFMPKEVLQDKGSKWWFYHQSDYAPLKD